MAAAVFDYAKAHQLRIDTGLTRVEFCRQRLPVHKDTLKQVELGRFPPSLRLVCRLADALDVDPGELFTREPVTA